MPLKIDMDDTKIELLFRSALLDDARNTSQQMAALSAEISIDDDSVDIILDDVLWEDVELVPTVDSLANMLGLELEWAASLGGEPFAWPGLGEHFNNTSEYFETVMEAYRGQHKKEQINE